MTEKGQRRSERTGASTDPFAGLETTARIITVIGNANLLHETPHRDSLQLPAEKILTILDKLKAIKKIKRVNSPHPSRIAFSMPGQSDIQLTPVGYIIGTSSFTMSDVDLANVAEVFEADRQHTKQREASLRQLGKSRTESMDLDNILREDLSAGTPKLAIINSQWEAVYQVGGLPVRIDVGKNNRYVIDGAEFFLPTGISSTTARHIIEVDIMHMQLRAAKVAGTA